MSEGQPQTEPRIGGAGSPQPAEQTPIVACAPDLIDASARMPVAVLYVGGALWLLVASAFGLLASVKFHSPNFLANAAWLTYGRMLPASTHALLYGFCVPAGLGTGLWLLARLGRTIVRQGWLVVLGALVWNLGVLIGVGAILGGDGTGFENLEFPKYAGAILFLGYLPIGVAMAFTFHARAQRTLYPSQWYLLTALFWFPWIFSTAHLLLMVFPVRGMAQAVLAWWYSQNLQGVWFWLLGLATVLYLVPKIARRELQSRNLALFAYWALLLFAPWAGVPPSAPVPAWLPSLSHAALTMVLIPLIAVALMAHRTLAGSYRTVLREPVLRFVAVGILALLIAGLMQIVASTYPVSRVLNFTWFITATTHLNVYGFFAMTMFGAAYYIAPRVLGGATTWARVARVHFWLAAIGLVLVVVPLAIGGVVQGLQLNDPTIAFVNIARVTLHFLRFSTLGDLFLAAGHVLLAAYLLVLCGRFCRAQAAAAYRGATVDVYETAGVGG